MLRFLSLNEECVMSAVSIVDAVRKVMIAQAKHTAETILSVLSAT